MDDLVARLDWKLRSLGIPLIGVRVGNPADRSTLIAAYDPSATSQQRTQGESALATTNPSDTTEYAGYLDALAQNDYASQKMLQALGQALWECIPNPTMTKVQLKARAIALYKAL